MGNVILIYPPDQAIRHNLVKMARDSDTLPLQFIGQSFSFLFKVMLKPGSFTAREMGWLVVNHSLSELILKIQDKVFPRAWWLLRLGIAALLVLAVIQTSAYVILNEVAGSVDRAWAVRNLFFLSMINVGLGSLLLIGVNLAAGLYAMVAGNLLSLFLFLLASIHPSLELIHVGLFSHTGDQQGLSYTLGSLAVGCCLIFYATWYRRLGPPQDLNNRKSRPELTSIIPNFLFTFLVILGYAILFYWVSQRWPGQKYPYLFVGMLCIPAIATILIRYGRSGSSLDAKGVTLLCTPVIAFSFAAYSIYKFLGESFFHDQFPQAPAGTWIEGVGLGMLIGMVVGSYFMFIHLLVATMLNSRVKGKAGEEGIILLTTLITLTTWLSCILLGRFNHLNALNKPYTISGLVVGIALAYLASARRYKVSRAFVFILPFGGNLHLSNPVFPPTCQLIGTAKVHVTGTNLLTAQLTYDREFSPTVYDLRIHTTLASQDVSVDITHKGHTATVQGTLVNDSLITLQRGQPCPPVITENGFSADLTRSTVNDGFLTCIGGKTRIYVDLSAAGTVSASGLSVDVKGTVKMDAHN